MGTFRVDATLSHITDRQRVADVRGLLVDTGSEYTWIHEATLRSIGIDPEPKTLQFVMANGEIVERNLGFAIIHVEGHFTIDEVVFAEANDLQLVGARSLEGLNLTIDPRQKKLVAAGPLPVASSLS